MLFVSFIYALMLLAVGLFGMQGVTTAEEIHAVALPGLFYGGATLISSLYAIKEPRHGLSAASFLSFLAFLTNSASLITAFAKGGFQSSDPANRSAALVTVASLIYLVIALLTWKRNRREQAIKELQEGADPRERP